MLTIFKQSAVGTIGAARSTVFRMHVNVLLTLSQFLLGFPSLYWLNLDYCYYADQPA